MRDDYLTIGQFAEISEISASMLRHYDRVGLMLPAVVNPNTRYRFYRQEQVRTAGLIRLLRDLDVPLREIQGVVEDPEGPEMRVVLRRQRGRIEKRRDKSRRIISRLDRVLDGTGGLMPHDARLVEIEPQWVISRRLRTPVGQDVETVDRLLAELVHQAMGLAMHSRRSASSSSTIAAAGAASATISRSACRSTRAARHKSPARGRCRAALPPA